MYCCAGCFSDNFLQNHIIAVSNKKGKCSFCKANNRTLIKPEDLYDRFEPLLGLYERDSKGFAINQLIQRDWNIFTFSKNATQAKLLRKISGNDSLNRVKYKPKYLKDRENIEQWGEFREELKHKNRFFPTNAPDKGHLEPFGKHLGVILSPSPGAQKFYRARVNNADKPYPLSKMRKPPEKLATNGRANPNGIPYLYVASTIETAIAEIRGHKGEMVTVAEFQLKNNLELVDLRDPINTISPFELNDEYEIELLYKNMPYLTLLGNELSKPVIPREANLEYLPSQYLCELLKHIGYHGIIFKSSISDGNNYVIFNDRRLKATETYQYQITDVTIESKRQT
ncbi:MAG: RES family NAD+ phosphorylase [Desulfobacteraceae bacterium]|nr:RES family NAD+ phosphorylase [Desulfobacteraceae bacterium]